jgi:hypothetical protein
MSTAPEENPADATAEKELPKHLRDSFEALDKACTKFLRERVHGYAAFSDEQSRRNRSRHKPQTPTTLQD